MFTNRFPGGATYLRARAPSIFRAIFCATLAFCPAASAISIGWNTNPEADIASYQLHYGTTSGTYPDLIDAGNNSIAPVPGLTEGQTYYFVVIAVNADGLSSAPSAEISYTMPTNTTVNQPPVAIASTATTLEDSPTAIALSASDADNEPLAYTVTGSPTKGTLSGTAPNLTYTPNANANGADSFTFTVSDGNATSNTATVSITITPVNDAPVANASSATTLEDSPTAIALSGNDADGVSLNYTVTVSPTKGTLTGTAPNLTYTPAANANGADSFKFTVSDGKATSSTAAVSITITPVNDAPVAIAKSFSTDEQVPVSITLTATDVDGGVLTYSVVTQPTGGTLTGTAPNLTYTPNAGFSGADSFTFKAHDASLDSKTATVALTVKKSSLPENPKLLARTGWKLIHVDSEDAIDNPASFAIDGDPATFWHTLWKSGATPPPHEIRIDIGAVRSLEGFRYLPRQDGFFVGNIGQYQFRTSLDGIHWSSAANGTFTNDNDEKEALFTTRNARFVSLIALSDASGSIHACIAEFNILGTKAVNSAPLAKSASVTTVQKTALPITLEASDGEEDPLVFTILSSPSNGTLTGTAPELTYTPDAPFTGTGTDTFTYQVSDGTLTSAIATITINVKSKGGRENRPPAFKSNPITRAAGFVGEPYKASSLTDSADDPDKSDTITYSKVSGPDWIDITPSGKLHGTPPAGSLGSHRFTIRATDKAGASDETILFIEIKTAELPLPWDFKALGNSGENANAFFNDGAFTLTAAGDLSGDADAASYVWQTLSGDGQITARVSDLDGAGKSARAGLMIRDSLAANSKQVFIGVNGNGDFRWIRRTRTGAESLMKSTGKGTNSNTWLGLSRRGDTITAYRSDDGKDWVKIGSITRELGKNCYIGPAVSSGKNATSTATFRNVKLNP